MTRTQVQLPNALYQRAKRFAADRGISLAERARRGLELLFDRYPDVRTPSKPWQLPRVDGGGISVPLDRLHEVAADDQESRGVPRE